MHQTGRTGNAFNHKNKTLHTFLPQQEWRINNSIWGRYVANEITRPVGSHLAMLAWQPITTKSVCISAGTGRGYIEDLLDISLVGTDLGLGHWLHSLTHPLDIHKLHSGNLIHHVSLLRRRKQCCSAMSHVPVDTYHSEEDVDNLVLLEQLLELIHSSIANAQDHNGVLHIAVFVTKDTPTCHEWDMRGSERRGDGGSGGRNGRGGMQWYRLHFGKMEGR